MTATPSPSGRMRCSQSRIYSCSLKKPTHYFPPSYQPHQPTASRNLTTFSRSAARVLYVFCQQMSLVKLFLRLGTPTFNLSYPHLYLFLRPANFPSHLTHHLMILTIPQTRGGKQFSHHKLIAKPQDSCNPEQRITTNLPQHLMSQQYPTYDPTLKPLPPPR